MRKPTLPEPIERAVQTPVGIVKGLKDTFTTMLQGAVTVQYPHEKETLAPRTRGVIALLEENCTVCMLCARECPDWCIYIESHQEPVPGTEYGGGDPARAPAGRGRQRMRNVLDRFAIDFSLCMYCGICVEA